MDFTEGAIINNVGETRVFSSNCTIISIWNGICCVNCRKIKLCSARAKVRKLARNTIHPHTNRKQTKGSATGKKSWSALKWSRKITKICPRWPECPCRDGQSVVTTEKPFGEQKQEWLQAASKVSNLILMIQPRQLKTIFIIWPLSANWSNIMHLSMSGGGDWIYPGTSTNKAIHWVEVFTLLNLQLLEFQRISYLGFPQNVFFSCGFSVNPVRLNIDRCMIRNSHCIITILPIR